MKVIVSGGTGFIGKSLLKHFDRNNIEYVNLVRNKCDAYQSKNNFYLDFENFSSLDFQIFHDVDVFIHLAGLSESKRSYSASELIELYRVNTELTYLFACASLEIGIKRFIFLSSSKASSQHLLFNINPHFNDLSESSDPYAYSKLWAEQKILNLSHNSELECVIIRPPVVYGPDVKGNFDKLLTLLKKHIPLPFGAINNVRSYVALDNLVDFIALCADRTNSPKAANQVLMISDGNDVSTTTLIKKISKAYGIKPVLLPVPVSMMKFAAKLIRKSDLSERLFGNALVDVGKTQDLLGWKPIISMDEQLRSMAHYDKQVK